MRQVIYDAQTGKITFLEVQNDPVPEITEAVKPTLEERVKATEDAILMLMDMGV